VIRTGTLESAQANRRHLVLANGTGYWRSDLIKADSIEAGWSPQAFLVEQDAGSTILPHYHERNEFQVVVEGGGSFGRHPVRPVTAHYAARHTGYGPIVSGKDGLWYFSLRANTDPGARFLPEARATMEKGPKRHILAEPVDGSLAKTVIEPQPDGVAAWVLKQPMPAPGDAARFYVVLAGEVSWRGEKLPRFSVVFATEPFNFEGSGSLLCLQFPC
jgi:hypothetical protein